MAMKKSNSVRIKPTGTPKFLPLSPTTAPKPTMRSTAKDKPLTAKEKAAGTKRGLNAANKPAGYASADEARLQNLYRVFTSGKSKPSAADKIALKRILTDLHPTQMKKPKATLPNRLTDTKMKRVPNVGRGRGGIGGLNINNLKK